MIFIDYKGPVKEVTYYCGGSTVMTYDIDECITITFSRRNYNKLQKHLKQLGFEK